MLTPSGFMAAVSSRLAKTISSMRSARSGRRQLLQLDDLPEGHGQQVAGIVGKAVEDQVGELCAVDDHCRLVVTHPGQVRERSLHRCRIARRLNVIHAPIGVKLLHRGEPSTESDGGSKVKDLPIGEHRVSFGNHAGFKRFPQGGRHRLGRRHARGPDRPRNLGGADRRTERHRANNTF